MLASAAHHIEVEDRTASFVPSLELVRDRVLKQVGSNYVEVEAATLRLSFTYDGVRIPADTVGDRGPGGELVLRNTVEEARARILLESFGVVEVGLLDDCLAGLDTSCHYVIDLHDDPDALCQFTLLAVPKLREAGWDVSIAEDYPFKVVEPTAWYARVNADDDTDWFELDLGVEVSGSHVDLLPLLLDLLESGRDLDSLARSRRAFMTLPLGGNEHLAVPPDRVRRVLKILRELYEIDGRGDGGGVRVPFTMGDVLDELGDALGSLDRRHGGSGPKRAPRSVSKPEPAPQPRHLRATLRPYQAEGVGWLRALAERGEGGILADDMGLGKTLQTIAHICLRREEAKVQGPALVVAPTSVAGNWQRELQKFAPHLKVVAMHGPRRAKLRDKMKAADVVITTYPVLIRDIDVLSSHTWDGVILDEAQAIKNARSQAHAAAVTLEAQHRICLTGTPIENNLEELHAQFEFARPGLLGDAMFFRTRFRQPIEREGSEERLESLRKRVAPFILRRTKDMVVHDLPPKSEIVHAVELRGEQRDLYESIRIAAHAAVRGVIRKKGIAASTIDILGALMKLRQVCCDPRLVPVDAARRIQDSAKYEELMEMVPTLLSEGRRILLFSQFTSMLSLIGDGLRARGIRFLSLTGSTGDRQGKVDAFERGDADVFLISLKAGGTGLNLTSADTVIHYDPWWNPAAQRQATDRAYRIGQKKPVFVYNMIVAGSVEERMIAIQQRKQALADGVLAGGDHSAGLTAAEVDHLFDPLEGEEGSDPSAKTDSNGEKAPGTAKTRSRSGTATRPTGPDSP